MTRRGAGYVVERSSTWLSTHVLWAYLLVVFGVVAAFVAMGLGFARVTARIDATARQACEAGNERSRIQRDDYVQSRAQTQSVDLGKLLGLSPEQAADVRRLSIEATDRRIASLPFLDCKTGKRVPAP